MTRKIYPLLTLLIGVMISGMLLQSCATGKRRFEQGDYDAATMQAIKRLRNNPDSKKARKYLPLAYQHALDYHLNMIKMLNQSAAQFRHDDIVNHYSQLNMLYNEIVQCPACLEIVPKPRMFQKEYNDATLAASKAHFDAGLVELKKGTKEDARVAYGHFIRAKDYTPKFNQIDKYIADALDQGTIRVLIEDIPVHSRTLQLSNEFFQNQIIEYARSRNYTFVQFYREAELNALDIQPDQVLVMKFDDFVVGQTFFKEKTTTIVKDSVVVGTVETEEGEKDVYGKAEADLTTFEKTLTSSGLLDFQIVDAHSGATLQQRKMPGTFVWRTDWATYNGQKAALTDEQIAASKRREAFPPLPQDLFVEFTRPIYTQLIRSIDQFYRAYN